MSADKAACILDGDATYQSNARALLHRYQQRKIGAIGFNHIQQWLAAAAMRRHERHEAAQARAKVQSWAALSLQTMGARRSA